MRRRALWLALASVLVLGVTAIQAADPAPAKIRVLLITGDDAAPSHNWREMAGATREALEASDRFDVRVSEDARILESATALADYDVIVFTRFDRSKTPLSGEAQENLLAFVNSGKGFYVQHLASASFPTWEEWGKLVGRRWIMGISGHGPRTPFEAKVVDREHPITKGMENFQADDELYAKLQGDAPIQVLVEADSDWSKRTEPLVFVLEYGKGRSAHNAFGHDAKILHDPNVQRLITRSVEWAATGAVKE